nr:winged helix-turn-helix transcriptional regulator [uncultured Dongia sp.]
MARDRSIFLAGHSVRLFKRCDRPTRFWQAAFRRPGSARPLVKSTGQAELPQAKSWALDYLAQMGPPPPPPAGTRPGIGENLLGAYPFPKIRQEKRHVERELAMRTLSAYHADPHLSQRRLAAMLNVSLAVVNVYTAQAVREGWLLKLDRPQGQGGGYRYLLTDAGLGQVQALASAYLGQGLALYRRLRDAFIQLLAESGDAEIALIGAGEMLEIAIAVLAAHGRAPVSVASPDSLFDLTRHAVKRHRHHLVCWLATPGDTAAVRDFLTQHLPGVALLAPRLVAFDAPVF